MKTSPNREQQLFLVAGGVILVLILVVVTVNVMRSTDSPEQVTEENVTPRPVVNLPAPGKNADRTAGSSSWAADTAPAPVFGKDQEEQPDQEEADLETPAEGDEGSVRPPSQAHQATGATNKGRSSALSPLDGAREMLATNRGKGNTGREEDGEDSVEPNTASERNPGATGTSRLSRTATEPPLSTSKAPASKKVGKTSKKETHVALTSEETRTLPKARPSGKNASAQKPAEDYSDVIAKIARKNEIKPTPSAPQSAKVSPPDMHQSAPGRDGFSVQVASFSQASKATELVEKVSALLFEGRRLPVYQSGGRGHYRVRIGPFANRMKAERVVRFVSQKAGISGHVMPPSQ